MVITNTNITKTVILTIKQLRCELEQASTRKRRTYACQSLHAELGALLSEQKISRNNSQPTENLSPVPKLCHFQARNAFSQIGGSTAAVYNSLVGAGAADRKSQLRLMVFCTPHRSLECRCAGLNCCPDTLEGSSLILRVLTC